MIGPDLLDLGGQAALVTGAGQGAGRGIALMLARHDVGGVAYNPLDRAETTVQRGKTVDLLELNSTDGSAGRFGGPRPVPSESPLGQGGQQQAASRPHPV